MKLIRLFMLILVVSTMGMMLSASEPYAGFSLSRVYSGSDYASSSDNVFKTVDSYTICMSLVHYELNSEGRNVILSNRTENTGLMIDYTDQWGISFLTGNGHLPSFYKPTPMEPFRLVVVYDEDISKASIYINGEKRAEDVIYPLLSSTSTNFSIGTWHYSDSSIDRFKFLGEISQLQIYSGVAQTPEKWDGRQESLGGALTTVLTSADGSGLNNDQGIEFLPEQPIVYAEQAVNLSGAIFVQPNDLIEFPIVPPSGFEVEAIELLPTVLDARISGGNLIYTWSGNSLNETSLELVITSSQGQTANYSLEMIPPEYLLKLYQAKPNAYYQLAKTDPDGSLTLNIGGFAPSASDFSKSTSQHDLVLDQLYYQNSVTEQGRTIEAREVTVAANQILNIRAHKSIKLKSGFKVKKGAMFLASSNMIDLDMVNDSSFLATTIDSGNTVTLDINLNPENGQVNQQGDALVYSSNQNFIGFDSFSYRTLMGDKFGPEVVVLIDVDRGYVSDAPVVSGPSLSNQPRPSFSWTPYYPVLSNEKYRIAYDSTNFNGLNGFEISGRTFVPPANLNDGTHFILVQQKVPDHPYLWSQSARFDFVIDQTPPELTQVSVVALTGDSRPTWTIAGNGATHYRVRLDQIDMSQAEAITSSYYQSPFPLGHGEHTLYVQAVDDLGNVSSLVQSSTFVDLRPPEFYYSMWQDGFEVPGEGLDVFIGIEDNDAVIDAQSIKLWIDGLVHTFNWDGIQLSTTFSNSNDGLHVIRVEASDMFGNEGRLTYSFEIEDGKIKRAQDGDDEGPELLILDLFHVNSASNTISSNQIFQFEVGETLSFTPGSIERQEKQEVLLTELREIWLPQKYLLQGVHTEFPELTINVQQELLAATGNIEVYLYYKVKPVSLTFHTNTLMNSQRRFAYDLQFVDESYNFSNGTIALNFEWDTNTQSDSSHETMERWVLATPVNQDVIWSDPADMPSSVSPGTELSIDGVMVRVVQRFGENESIPVTWTDYILPQSDAYKYRAYTLLSDAVLNDKLFMEDEVTVDLNLNSLNLPSGQPTKAQLSLLEYGDYQKIYWSYIDGDSGQSLEGFMPESLKLIYWPTHSIHETTEINLNSSDTQHTLSGLVTGVEYQLVVKLVDQDKVSLSSILAFTPALSVPSGFVSGLKLNQIHYAQGSTQGYFDWYFDPSIEIHKDVIGFLVRDISSGFSPKLVAALPVINGLSYYDVSYSARSADINDATFELLAIKKDQSRSVPVMIDIDSSHGVVGADFRMITFTAGETLPESDVVISGSGNGAWFHALSQQGLPAQYNFDSNRLTQQAQPDEFAYFQTLIDPKPVYYMRLADVQISGASNVMGVTVMEWKLQDGRAEDPMRPVRKLHFYSDKIVVGHYETPFVQDGSAHVYEVFEAYGEIKFYIDSYEYPLMLSDDINGLGAESGHAFVRFGAKGDSSIQVEIGSLLLHYGEDLGQHPQKIFGDETWDTQSVTMTTVQPLILKNLTDTGADVSLSNLPADLAGFLLYLKQGAETLASPYKLISILSRDAVSHIELLGAASSLDETDYLFVNLNQSSWDFSFTSIEPAENGESNELTFDPYDDPRPNAENTLEPNLGSNEVGSGTGVGFSLTNTKTFNLDVQNMLPAWESTDLVVLNSDSLSLSSLNELNLSSEYKRDGGVPSYQIAEGEILQILAGKVTDASLRNIVLIETPEGLPATETVLHVNNDDLQNLQEPFYADDGLVAFDINFSLSLSGASYAENYTDISLRFEDDQNGTTTIDLLRIIPDRAAPAVSLFNLMEDEVLVTGGDRLHLQGTLASTDVVSVTVLKENGETFQASLNGQGFEIFLNVVRSDRVITLQIEDASGQITEIDYRILVDPALAPLVTDISPPLYGGSVAGGEVIDVYGHHFRAGIEVQLGQGLLKDIEVISESHFRGVTPPQINFGWVDMSLKNTTGSTLLTTLEQAYEIRPTLTCHTLKAGEVNVLTGQDLVLYGEAQGFEPTSGLVTVSDSNGNIQTFPITALDYYISIHLSSGSKKVAIQLENSEVEVTQTYWVDVMTGSGPGPSQLNRVLSLSTTEMDPTNSTSIQFSLSGNDIVEFRYRLDRERWSTPAPLSDIELSELSTGRHEIEVMGRNYLAKWQSPVASWAWTIDTSTPVIEMETYLEGSPISSETPSFVIKVNDNQSLDASSIVMTLSNGDVLEDVNITNFVFSQGEINWTPSSNLLDQNYTLLTQISDHAGSSTTHEFDFLVDTQPPVVSFTNLNDGDQIVTNRYGVLLTALEEGSGLNIGASEFRLNGTLVNAVWDQASANIQLPAMQDGEQSLTWSVLDQAGLANTGQMTFYIDTTPVVLNITNAENQFNLNQPLIEGEYVDTHSSVNISSMRVSLNGVSRAGSEIVFDQQNFSWQPASPLKDGGYTLSVIASEASGLISQTDYNFSVDTTSPRTRFNYSDGQILSSDIPVLRFEVLDDLQTFDSSSMTLLVDGTTPAGLNVASKEMTWLPSGLSAGLHQVFYSVSDHLGNTTTGNIQIIFDIAPPEIAWLSPATDAAVAQARPLVSATVNDSTTGVVSSTIIFKLNQVTQSGWSFSGNNFTWLPGSDLPEGQYLASLQVQDAAGWQSESSFNFSVDVQGPVIGFNTPFNPADLKTTRPTVEATVYDTLAGLDPAITFMVNNAVQPASLNNATLSWTATSDLPEGLHTFEITALDVLGNSSTEQHQVVLDANGPSIISMTEAVQTGSDIEVRTDITDAGSGLVPSSVNFNYNGEMLSPVLSSGNEFYLDLPGSFQEGDHSIVVSATDEYGNSSQRQIDFTLDFTPPSISFITPSANAFMATSAFTEIVVHVSDLTSGLDESSLVLKLDDVLISGLSITTEGNIHFNLPELLAEGEHKIEVGISDVAGLQRVVVNNFITESTTGPELSWLVPNEAQIFSEVPSIEVSFNPISGPIDVSKTEVWLDNADISASLEAEASLTASGLLTSLDNLTGGEHTLKLVVWDINGGSTTESRTFAYQGQLSVDYSVEPAGAGSVTPLETSNVVEYGSQLQLNAIPSAGFIFDHWEGSLVGSNPSIGVHVYENMNIVAVFRALPQQLVIDSSQAVSLTTNPNTGMIDFLSGRYPTTGSTPAEKVENFVESYKAELGYNISGATYTYEDDSDATNDRVIIRQNINGIEVIGAEVLAILDKANGDLLALSGSLQNLETLVSTECSPGEEGACLTLALEDMGVDSADVSIEISKHVVFNKMAFSQQTNDDKAEMALMLHLVATEKPIDTIYYIKHDASEILYKIENSFGALAVQGYESTTQRLFPGTTLTDFASYPGVQTAYDTFKAYFEQQHEQINLGKAGAEQLKIVLDYGPTNEKRAFYFNNHIVFSPGFYSHELIAHEASHAVVGYRTPLYYAYEAGAINEAISDTFAILVKSYNLVDQSFDASVNWEITANTEILRDLSDPKRLDVTGGQRPAHMSEFKVPEDESDNGGVHVNGSILTLAFYLMANGTDAQGHNGKVVSAMGYQTLSDTLYRTMDFLTSTSSFSEFRAAFLLALTEVAPTQVQNAKDAFFAVGLTSGTTTELLYDPDYGLVQTIYIPDLDQNYELPIHLELTNFSVAAGVDYQKTATHTIAVANVDVQNSASSNPAGQMHLIAGRAIYLGNGFEVETEASFSTTLNGDLALNQAPVVEVGNDLFLPFPSTIPLNGAFSDDGLPSGFETSVKWKVVQKPAAAEIDPSFVDDQLNTSALVSHPGLYKFRLEVSDGSRLSSREFNVFLDNSEPEHQINSPLGSPLVNSLTDLLSITVSDSDSGLDFSNIAIYLDGIEQDGLTFTTSDPLSEINSDGLTEFQESFHVNGLFDPNKIATGIRTSFIVRNDGILFAWGNNANGELGLGYEGSIESSPKKVEALENVIAISAGDKHTLALDKYGRVWSFGSNDQHQLGFDDSVSKSSLPRLLDLGVSAKTVLARDSWSMAIDVNGDLWVWGSNTDGQLGLGHTNTVETPQKLSGYNFVKLFGSMQGSYASVMAIDNQNQVWAWGSGYHGKLTLALAPIDSAADPNLLTPTLIPTLENFTAFTLGQLHGVGVDAAGIAKSWGANDYGQLGRTFTGSDENPVALENAMAVPVYFGSAVYSSSYLAQNRSLWTWGKATHGNLGRNVTGAYDQVPGQVAIADVVGYAHEHVHAIVLDVIGQVWSFGYNSTGQLGDGTTTTQNTPVMIPEFKAYVPVIKTIYSTADIEWQPSTSLNDGVYELELVVTNHAGITSNIPIEFELYSTPPSVVFSYPTHQQGINNNEPLITATISEDYSELDLNSLEFELDGQVIKDYNFDGTNFSYQADPLVDGEHKLVLKIRDTANNLNQQNITFYLDHQAPTIAHNFAATHYQNSTSFNFTASITDAIGTITNVEIDWDGVPQSVSGSLENLSWSKSNLSPGSTYSFELRAYDQSNNMTQTSFDVMVETTEPSVVVDTWPTLPETPKYTVTTPIITVLVEDEHSGFDSNTASLLIDGKVTLFNVNDINPLDSNLDIQLSNLSQGMHRFQLSLRDRAGNEQSLDRQFMVDSIGPQVSSITPPSSELVHLGYESGAFIITIRYQDLLSGVDTVNTIVDVEVDNGTWLNNVPANKSQTALSVSLNQSQIISETITFRFTLVDQAGNSNVVLHPVHFENLKPEIRNLSPIYNITFFEGNFNIDVVDDPFRSGSELEITWELRSGPEEGKTADAYLSDIHSTNPSYILGKSGKYVFAVKVSDGSNITEAVTTVDFYNDVPLVQVGPSQIIELANATDLSATLEDEVLPYGGSYEWSWTTHSIPVGADDPTIIAKNSRTPSVNIQNSGRYTFKATVNDGEFDSVDSDSSYLEVYLFNEVPEVHAGEDQVIGRMYTSLNGTITDSTHPFGIHKAKTTWSRQSGPASVILSDNSEDIEAYFEKPGDYYLELKYHDGEFESSDVVKVKVLDYFTIGSSRNTFYRDTLRMFWQHDSKPSVYYEWQVIDQPEGSTVLLENSKSTKSDIVFDRVGEYTIRMNVTGGHYQSKDIVLTVVNEPPQVNIDDQVVLTTLESQLPGNITDDYPDDLVYRWSASRDVLISDRSAPWPRFTFPETGFYEVYLEIDDHDLATTKKTIVVEVDLVPEIEEVSMLWLGNENYELQATIKDDHPENLTYSWSLDLGFEDNNFYFTGNRDKSREPATISELGIYPIVLIVNDGHTQVSGIYRLQTRVHMEVGSHSQFKTIQQAIDQLPSKLESRAKIVVAPGEYEGFILDGASLETSASAPLLITASSLGDSIIRQQAVSNLITITNAPYVTLKGFGIDGANQSPERPIGVKLWNSDQLTLDTCWIRNFSSNESGIGVAAFNTNSLFKTFFINCQYGSNDKNFIVERK